jgi:DNA-binding beta-propeller fold protein YncE
MCSGCATPQKAAPEISTKELVWPLPPQTPRIKWLATWSNRDDFGKASEVLEFFIGKERVERLRRPNGIIADDEGTIYVADSEMRMIYVFDMKKNALRFLGMGTVAGPIGLAIDSNRKVLYVSDSRLDKIFGMNTETGVVVSTFGSPGELKNPSGMVFDDASDRLYVSDTQNHMVRVFDREGRPLFTIGKRGTEDGEFNYPSYLAMDNKKRLFVVDSFNFRVQIFDSEGNFLKKFGRLGDSSGYMSRPHGIGVDSDGNIYLVDAAFNNFQIFNEDGQLLLWVGNAGAGAGEFYLPSGLYIDKKDTIYVSDTFNRRIQVFKYLKQTP